MRTASISLTNVQDGDVLTLNGMCNQAETLPSFADPGGVGTFITWTLQGDPSNGVDGFDGSGLNERVLTGDDVHRLLIQDLTFRDSSTTGVGADGGAIEITGQSGVQIFNSFFFNNTANDRGGAVHVANALPPLGFNNLGVSALGNVFGSAAEPNRARTGGALSAESAGVNDQFSLTSNTFAGNTAIANGGAFDFEVSPGGGVNVSLSDNSVTGNKAGGSGGGGHVAIANTFLNVTNEHYVNNSVETMLGGPVGDHFGGGLAVDAQDPASPRVRNSEFRGNAVAGTGGDLGGGGLAIRGADLNVESEFSRFEGNAVAGQPSAGSGFESEGGGIYFSSSAGTWYSFLDAVAGNSVGAFGEGGGFYVGAATGAQLTLGETTVANNSVGAGGLFAGISGAGTDELIMRNSIVFNGAGDIDGFDSYNVTYSDACQGGAPFPGAGNICADPKLAGGTDVHQTTQSPTIDKGNDAYFESEGGGERNPTDYEGDPRPTDGDGDGHTIDMGADETPAGFITQQQPPPPPPPPPPTPQCSDQADNDGDGAIDLADPGCLPGPTDNNEGDETERDLVLCGQRTISLVRADVRGSRVVLSGIVAASVAGQKVDLSVRYLRGGGKAEKLGSVTPGADGKFQARVKKPPRRLFNLARYRAQVGSARSVELKLPQSLASSSLRQVSGGMLELRGQVDRRLLGKRNAVVVKRILCGRYTTVGQAKPNRRGAYVVRFPAPATTGGAALYRAESRVLARPGSKRYVRQFARALGITF